MESLDVVAFYNDSDSSRLRLASTNFFVQCHSLDSSRNYAVKDIRRFVEDSMADFNEAISSISTSEIRPENIRESVLQIVVDENRDKGNNPFNLVAAAKIFVRCWEDMKNSMDHYFYTVKMSVNGVLCDNICCVLSSSGRLMFVNEDFSLSCRPSTFTLTRMRLVNHKNIVECEFSVQNQVYSTSFGIWLYPSSDRLVVMDIDGTVTRSDVRGYIQSVYWGNYSYIHPGVPSFLRFLIESCRFQVIFLSSRPIAHQRETRNLLMGMKEYKSDDVVPVFECPLFLNTEKIIKAAINELIYRNSEHFKKGVLSDIALAHSLVLNSCIKEEPSMAEFSNTANICCVPPTDYPLPALSQSPFFLSVNESSMTGLDDETHRSLDSNVAPDVNNYGNMEEKEKSSSVFYSVSSNSSSSQMNVSPCPSTPSYSKSRLLCANSPSNVTESPTMSEQIEDRMPSSIRVDAVDLDISLDGNIKDEAVETAKSGEHDVCDINTHFESVNISSLSLMDVNKINCMDNLEHLDHLDHLECQKGHQSSVDENCGLIISSHEDDGVVPSSRSSNDVIVADDTDNSDHSENNRCISSESCLKPFEIRDDYFEINNSLQERISTCSNNGNISTLDDIPEQSGGNGHTRIYNKDMTTTKDDNDNGVTNDDADEMVDSLERKQDQCSDKLPCPFVLGIGNRESDVKAYLRCHIPIILLIDTSSNIRLVLRDDPSTYQFLSSPLLLSSSSAKTSSAPNNTFNSVSSSTMEMDDVERHEKASSIDDNSTSKHVRIEATDNGEKKGFRRHLWKLNTFLFEDSGSSSSTNSNTNSNHNHNSNNSTSTMSGLSSKEMNRQPAGGIQNRGPHVHSTLFQGYSDARLLEFLEKKVNEIDRTIQKDL